MSEAAITVAIVVAVFLIPWALYLFTHYEVPETFHLSLKRVGNIALGSCLVGMFFNLFRFGFSFENWRWEWLYGLLIAAPFALSIDWLVQRNRRLRTVI